MRTESAKARERVAVRCPACHEPLEEGQPAYVCPDRHAAIHEECLELCPKCPVVGCDAPLGGGSAEERGALEIRPEELAALGERQEASAAWLLAGTLTRVQRDMGWNQLLGAGLPFYSAFLLAAAIFDASTNSTGLGAEGPLAAFVPMLFFLILTALPPAYVWYVWRKAVRAEASQLIEALGGPEAAREACRGWREALAGKPRAVRRQAERLARRRRGRGQRRPLAPDAQRLWALLEPPAAPPSAPEAPG